MRFVGIFLLCGAFITALDQLHARTVLEYAAPSFLGQPWWVFPFLGAVSVGAVAMNGWFVGRTERDPRTTDSLLLNIGWFAVVFSASAAFWRHEWICLLLFSALFLLRFLRIRPFAYSLRLAAFGGALVVLGVAGELALVAGGAIRWKAAGLWGIPAWIPGIYLHAALLADSIAAPARAPRPEN